MAHLADVLDCTEAQVRDAIRTLGGRLESAGSLEIIHIAGGIQLCTKAVYSPLIARFVKPQQNRLSRSVMEVLAIVAYRQPITLSEIEAVRGVQSDYGMRQLVERRLVKEVGKKQTPGRPTLYGTTQQFLHQFNLKDLESLPSLNLSLAPPSIEVQEPVASPADRPLPGLELPSESSL